MLLSALMNAMGNIQTLHSYHRNRVSEENRRPFGRLVGIGTIIIGLALIAFGILNYLASSLSGGIFTVAANVTLIAGLVIGFSITFFAMIKYNKGIF